MKFWKYGQDVNVLLCCNLFILSDRLAEWFSSNDTACFDNMEKIKWTYSGFLFLLTKYIILDCKV
jgi:hypothetical protein